MLTTPRPVKMFATLLTLILRTSTTHSFLAVFIITLLAVVQSSDVVRGQDNHGHDNSAKTSVTVAFGGGLNNVGTAANHHVLPRTIEVQAGGVVHFVVSGFHQILVYTPGTGVEDIQIPPSPAGLFLNDFTPENTYYLGLNPANMMIPGGGNPIPTSPKVNLAIRTNTGNRVESVGFAEPGLYLVICNIIPHFQDGMYAWVRVVGGAS